MYFTILPLAQIAFPVTATAALTISGFRDYISFSITIQPRLTILGPHIDHGGYMSVGHVSHYLALVLREVFVISLVSL
jgi:hypothetical protein